MTWYPCLPKEVNKVLLCKLWFCFEIFECFVGVWNTIEFSSIDSSHVVNRDDKGLLDIERNDLRSTPIPALPVVLLVDVFPVALFEWRSCFGEDHQVMKSAMELTVDNSVVHRDATVNGRELITMSVVSETRDKLVVFVSWPAFQLSRAISLSARKWSMVIVNT